MAQGDPWRIAVGVKIPNPSFKFPTLWSSTFSSNYTSGTRLYITDTSPDFDKVLKVGDKITIGSSSYSGSEGAVETKEITAIDLATPPTYVDIDSALTYDYSSGDKIFAVGSNMAAGWGLFGESAFTMEGIDNVGYDDDWAQKFDASASSTGWFRIDPQWDVGIILESVKYYMFLAYKGTVSGSVYAYFADGSGYAIALPLTTSADFIEKSGAGTTDASLTSLAYVGVRLGAGDSVSNLVMDCWALQHAKNSSGESNGYYQFVEYPDFGSVSWKPIHPKKRRRLPSGSLKIYDPSGLGERSRKIELKAHFSRVSQSFWDEIKLFLDWQEKGNLLNLFPFIDDLPPFLQGEMEILNISKDHWDLSKRSFDLIFREA